MSVFITVYLTVVSIVTTVRYRVMIQKFFINSTRDLKIDVYSKRQTLNRIMRSTFSCLNLGLFCTVLYIKIEAWISSLAVENVWKLPLNIWRLRFVVNVLRSFYRKSWVFSAYFGFLPQGMLARWVGIAQCFKRDSACTSKNNGYNDVSCSFMSSFERTYKQFQ